MKNLLSIDLSLTKINIIVLKKLLDKWHLIFFNYDIMRMTNIKTTPYIMVLGITQDTGYPQINCSEHCCRSGTNQN